MNKKRRQSVVEATGDQEAAQGSHEKRKGPQQAQIAIGALKLGQLERQQLRRQLTKTERVNIRVTAGEKESIFGAAKQCGMKVTEYLVKCHEIVSAALAEPVRKKAARREPQPETTKSKPKAATPPPMRVGWVPDDWESMVDPSKIPDGPEEKRKGKKKK